MTDITDMLCALMARGYRFVHPRNANGTVVAVTGIRAHHDVIDVVQLYGERDADAVRMCGTEQDVLAPRRIFWRTTGTPDAVIADLLDLAEPTAASAAPAGLGATPAVSSAVPAGSSAVERSRRGDGAALSGCWVPTKPGRSTWLPTSA